MQGWTKGNEKAVRNSLERCKMEEKILQINIVYSDDDDEQIDRSRREKK